MLGRQSGKLLSLGGVCVWTLGKIVLSTTKRTSLGAFVVVAGTGIETHGSVLGE